MGEERGDRGRAGGGLDEYADEGHLRLTTRGALSRHRHREWVTEQAARRQLELQEARYRFEDSRLAPRTYFSIDTATNEDSWYDATLQVENRTGTDLDLSVLTARHPDLFLAIPPDGSVIKLIEPTQKISLPNGFLSPGQVYSLALLIKCPRFKSGQSAKTYLQLYMHEFTTGRDWSASIINSFNFP
jgi:hypothetical protein